MSEGEGSGPFRVSFRPDGASVQVAPGILLSDAAAAAGIEIKSSCGGQGTCGLCAVRITRGVSEQARSSFPARLRALGYVAACQTRVTGDVEVEVPTWARLGRHDVLLDGAGVPPGVIAEQPAVDLCGHALRPLAFRLMVQAEPPTLEGNADDWSRVATAMRSAMNGPIGADRDRPVCVSLGALAQVPGVMRTGNWRAAVYVLDLPHGYEVIRVLPQEGAPPPLGLAIDIGTTTVVVHLVDLDTGTVLARAGSHNRQARYGDDVITRIIHSVERPDGAGELRRAVQATINDLIGQVSAASGRRAEDVLCAVIAGNTTMQHLFLGLPANQIRLEPYVPAVCEYPPLPAGQLGLDIHPDGKALLMPAVSSYVGGDIVAGLLVAGLDTQDQLALFVDIGTNGEMVLGNRDWLVACACSAGPCFEGGGITAGMRAVDGAIQSVRVDPATWGVCVRTVGGGAPAGVCGSGLIDCLSQLRRAGIIDRAGAFTSGPGPCASPDARRRRSTPDGPEFVLAWGGDSSSGGDVVITETDVKNLVRAKGAVFAGVRSLLAALESDIAAVARIDIAGGFGSAINIEDAVRIGMLPDVPRDRYRFLGNTAVKGARLALMSQDAYLRARELSRAITVIELSTGNRFMEEYVSALFLPHTDLGLFPSVRE